MDSEVNYHGTDLWASDRVSLFAWDALFLNILIKCMSVQYCACLHMKTGSLDSNWLI